jgi:GxxExxY protein
MDYSRSRTKTRWLWSLPCGTFLTRQQPAFDILYKAQKVGLFVPDLIVFDSIVVDTKIIDRITDHERGLMLNYLRITGLRVGVILNFKHRKLEWERIVL